MSRSVEIVKKVFEHRSVDRLPKGEIWLGTELLRKANLEDNLEGHVTLIERLNQDILCLPLSNYISTNKGLGYRYFSLKELKEASKMRALFLVALIDGPFQRIGEEKGLMKTLSAWKQERDEVAKKYEKKRKEVNRLIESSLELSVDAIIIAEDLAGEGSLFFDPKHIEEMFAPFYTWAVSKIHSGDSYALFHSCGNITRLIPQLVSYGFDGLAAIQHRANDLFSLKERYRSNLTFMAGIEAEMLEGVEMPLSGLKEYRRLVRSLSQGGGFILCSSSGLYSGDFFERIHELYRIADELFNHHIRSTSMG
jgi:hypothetical protein